MKTVPISPIQEHFWLHEKLYPGNTAFNIPGLIYFRGIPDVSALEKSINTLINRHEILRTVIKEAFPVALMEISEPGEKFFKPEVVALNKPFDRHALPEEIFKEVHKAFSFDQWPLMRFKLFTFSDLTSLLCIVFPHIIVDLHSKDIFSQELSLLYNEAINGKESEPGNIPAGYSEFSLWYKQWLSSDDALEMEESWKKEFPPGSEPFVLPFDFENPSSHTLPGKKMYFDVGEDLSSYIKEFARSTSLNAFTVMLTAYAIFLHRLTDSETVTVGVPLTNRRRPEFKNTFGCFINAVPLKIDFSNDPFGLHVLKQIRMSMLKAHRNQEVPLVRLNELLRKEGANSGENIFRVGFTFEHLLNFSFDGLPSEPLPCERKGAQADLYFTLWEDQKGFHGYCEYSSELFTEDKALLFTEVYLNILAEFVKMPNLRAGQFLNNEAIPTENYLKK